MERRSDWSFVITENGWHWTVTRPDRREEHSSLTFKTLDACGKDAIKHGYGAWRFDERRVAARDTAAQEQLSDA